MNAALAAGPAITELALEIAKAGTLAFAATLFVLLALAREAGYWLGRRRAKAENPQAEGVGVIVGSMLALLTFILALTLSNANARFQERRAGALAEANAIATAWLQARAIDHPRAAEIARLFEVYAPVRRDFVASGLDETVLEQLNARTDVLQFEMWGHLAALMREQPNPITAAFMKAVGDAFDRAAAERFALSFSTPASLFWLLIGMTLVTVGALGYQFGLRGLSVRVLSLALMGMLAMTMTGILELASPRLGNVRTATQPFEWTLQSFQNGVRIPALPVGR